MINLAKNVAHNNCGLYLDRGKLKWVMLKAKEDTTKESGENSIINASVER